MAADARRLMALSMVGPLAEEVAAQIDANLPVTPGSIENADIAADADIATTKLADGTEVAALVASDLVTAIATPAAYSEVPADISAALVAAGLMEPDA